MTVRRTSIVAYNTIKDNGLLSARRWEAYDALYRYGPGTTTEIGNSAGIEKHALQKRISELVQLGVANEVRERPCSVTGHTVIEYDVTFALPGALSRRKTKLDLAQARIAELEAEVAQLKSRLARMARTPV